MAAGDRARALGLLGPKGSWAHGLIVFMNEHLGEKHLWSCGSAGLRLKAGTCVRFIISSPDPLILEVIALFHLPTPTPIPSRPGMKYPVRATPSLRLKIV